MPIVPSNAGKKQEQRAHADAVELVEQRLTKVLSEHIKGEGSEAHIRIIVEKSIKEIAPFIITRPVTGQNLGGTVMTEAASMRNPVTGKHHKAPRNL